MAKVSLRAYDREIEGLIEHDQRTDEAIAHCRHILKTFPKHLETYRLLGKAYLEAKRYHEAVDIFERVLVAAPEDFVSHVGMSIIADDQGGLDEAIWHMERAFEMQPANAAIQGELQRLFARRDGVEPPKIRLTRGALARMYMQGELYNQAISEIKAVLGSDPKRSDMQVLLAKASYLSGQKVEATTISTELLARYPYCLDANRLMAEILPTLQRAEAAQEYRQRVIELDPYAAFATDSLFRPESAADSAVSLDRLEYSASMTEQTPILGLGPGPEAKTFTHPAREPEWLANGGAAMPPSEPASEPEAQPAPEVPDFLKEAGWNAKSSDVGAEQVAQANEPQSESAAVPANLPEWIQAFAPLEAGDSIAEPEPVGPPMETPDWLAGLGPAGTKEAPAAPAAEVPDWLAGLSATPKETPASPVAEAPNPPAEAPNWPAGLRASGAEETPVAPSPKAEADVPDWLRDLGGKDVDEPAALAKPPAEQRPSLATTQHFEPQPDETPVWLKDFASDLESPVRKTAPPEEPAAPEPAPVEPAADIGALGTSAKEQDDAMAWLESLAAKHGAKPEELVTDPNARKETAPDWVDQAKQMGEREPEAATPSQVPSPTDLDLTGKWLTSLQTGEFAENGSEPASQGSVDSQTFDWMSGLSEQGGFTAPAAETENEQQPIMEAGEAPAWLGDVSQPDASKSSGDEVPGWIDRETSKPEAGEPQTEPAGEVEPASTLDLPSWLAGLDAEEAAAKPETPSTDDVPPWLRPERESLPQAAEPTRPADWKPASPVEQPVPEAPGPEVESAVPATLPAAATKSTEHEKVVPPVSALKPRPVAQPPKPSGGGQTPLEGAQAELGRGNIAAALDVYARLIRKGRSLEEIIRDLRDALYRYPVEIPIWQALGDAYMRANRLQEALDAYTKAEELLR